MAENTVLAKQVEICGELRKRFNLIGDLVNKGCFPDADHYDPEVDALVAGGMNLCSALAEYLKTGMLDEKTSNEFKTVDGLLPMLERLSETMSGHVDRTTVVQWLREARGEDSGGAAVVTEEASATADRILEYGRFLNEQGIELSMVGLSPFTPEEAVTEFLAQVADEKREAATAQEATTHQPAAVAEEAPEPAAEEDEAPDAESEETAESDTRREFCVDTLLVPQPVICEVDAIEWLTDYLTPVLRALVAGFEAPDKETRESFHWVADDLIELLEACVAALGRGDDDAVRIEPSRQQPGNDDYHECTAILSQVVGYGYHSETPDLTNEGFAELARQLTARLEAEYGFAELGRSLRAKLEQEAKA